MPYRNDNASVIVVIVEEGGKRWIRHGSYGGYINRFMFGRARMRRMIGWVIGRGQGGDWAGSHETND